ncbi:eukaryotic translation initiation factor 4E [Drosophila serrata]|uniref:eukaryotic translation initiation factor 4E n=1 Tax=Drosophila serrata TaxID=7274 RepID=UPI000A1D313B|nr:eukaryotic translation initiation factor 4E [Drosophila serrata]
MVYTGYKHYMRQQADETEWLYGESNTWEQNLAAYTGEGIIPDEEPQLGSSLNTQLSLIDYELGMKHLLQHTWTVWHWENDRTKSWSDMLSDVTSFNTVEDFFSVYYFIKPPSDLKIFNDYMVFKQGIRPMWEDDFNKEGGRWIMLLDKASKAFSDKLWHDLLLCIIGECFEYSDQICGVVINVRNKANKLSLWTKNARNSVAVMAIGNQLKQFLHLGEMEIQYQGHKDAMVQHGPNVSALYRL